MIEVELKGKVRGDKEVAAMFARFPVEMTRAVRGWFWMVRDRFVGRKKGKKQTAKTGSYVSWLMGRRRRNRPGTWGKQAASAFRGFVTGGTATNANPKNVHLTVGIPQGHQTGFVRGLEGMSRGGYSIRSSNFMPIPIYQNLAGAGITSRTYRAFRSMNASDRLIAIRGKHTAGRVLWVDREAIEQGSDLDDATMYVGQKTTRVGAFQFQFEEKFRAILPRMIELGQKRIDRRIRDLERGYARAGKPK